MKITKIFFSPSGTTKKVVEQIASNFECESQIRDLMHFDSSYKFTKDDVVIVGMPVFAGRIPKTARDRLSKLTGNNTKAIADANYGNAKVGDALLELVDVLGENNFNVIAAISTVSILFDPFVVTPKLFNMIGSSPNTPVAAFDMLLNNILYGENIFNIITNNVMIAIFFSFFISFSPFLLSFLFFFCIF